MLRLASIAVAALAACSSSSKPHAAEEHAAAAPARGELARIPDDAVSVSSFSEGGPIIRFVREGLVRLPEGPPSCFDELVGRIEAQYSIERGASARQVQIFVGTFDRAAVEACVEKVGMPGVLTLSSERDGELSKIVQRITGRDDQFAWLEWSRDEVVAAGDPDTVRAVLANPHPLQADAPLAALWARTAGDIRFVTVRDFSSRPLGVPSTGLIASGRMEEAKRTKQLPLRVQYASEDDARRALAAIEALPARPDMPAGIAHVVELLHPRREAREVLIDYFAMTVDADALATMQAIVGTR